MSDFQHTGKPPQYITNKHYAGSTQPSILVPSWVGKSITILSGWGYVLCGR